MNSLQTEEIFIHSEMGLPYSVHQNPSKILRWNALVKPFHNLTAILINYSATSFFFLSTTIKVNAEEKFKTSVSHGQEIYQHPYIEVPARIRSPLSTSQDPQKILEKGMDSCLKKFEIVQDMKGLTPSFIEMESQMNVKRLSKFNFELTIVLSNFSKLGQKTKSFSFWLFNFRNPYFYVFSFSIVFAYLIKKGIVQSSLEKLRVIIKELFIISFDRKKRNTPQRKLLFFVPKKILKSMMSQQAKPKKSKKPKKGVLGLNEWFNQANVSMAELENLTLQDIFELMKPNNRSSVLRLYRPKMNQSIWTEVKRLARENLPVDLRDKCFATGQKVKLLHYHHMYARKTYPEYTYIWQNIFPLEGHLHNGVFHANYSVGNTTLDDLIDWLGKNQSSSLLKFFQYYNMSYDIIDGMDYFLNTFYFGNSVSSEESDSFDPYF
jgi:hypothetical protein